MISPQSLRDSDMPRPNIYLASVDSARLPGGVRHFYVAADFRGAAVNKAARAVEILAQVEGLGRANTTVKVRRLKLGDYLQDPSCIPAAIESAKLLGERGTVSALRERAQWLATFEPGMRAAGDVEMALGEALRALEAG